MNAVNEEQRCRTIGAAVLVDSFHTEQAVRNSACWVEHRCSAGEDRLLAAALPSWTAAEVERVPLETAGDGILTHLADGRGTGLQEDCHLRLRDSGAGQSRASTSIDDGVWRLVPALT